MSDFNYYYMDDHGNRLLNGCFFTTDPAICDYRYYGIQSDYFTPAKTMREDSSIIPIDYNESFSEAIEAAKEAHVSLFVMVFDKGKFLYELCVYDSYED